MPTYQHKPSTVEALQYLAPDGAEVEGNIDELSDFAAPAVLREQSPWNPADGQSCLLILNDAEDETTDLIPLDLVKPGDYLVKTSVGVVVVECDQFEVAYEPKNSAPAVQHAANPGATATA